jgi:hypothetical protein
MRINELIREDRVDENPLAAVGGALAGAGRAAVTGARALGNAAISGARALGGAAVDATRVAATGIERSIKAAGSAGEKMLTNPAGIKNLPINTITKAMGIPNQGSIAPDLKKALGLEKIPGNLNVTSVNGPGNKDSVEIDSSQLGAPISLNKDTFVGALDKFKQIKAQQDAQKAQQDANQADRTSIQANTGGASPTGSAGSTGGAN